MDNNILYHTVEAVLDKLGPGHVQFSRGTGVGVRFESLLSLNFFSDLNFTTA